MNNFCQFEIKFAEKIFSNTDEINANTFTECCLFVIPHPKAKFSQNEARLCILILKKKKTFLYLNDVHFNDICRKI